MARSGYPTGARCRGARTADPHLERQRRRSVFGVLPDASPTVVIPDQAEGLLVGDALGRIHFLEIQGAP